MTGMMEDDVLWAEVAPPSRQAVLRRAHCSVIYWRGSADPKSLLWLYRPFPHGPGLLKPKCVWPSASSLLEPALLEPDKPSPQRLRGEMLQKADHTLPLLLSPGGSNGRFLGGY